MQQSLCNVKILKIGVGGEGKSHFFIDLSSPNELPILKGEGVGGRGEGRGGGGRKLKSEVIFFIKAFHEKFQAGWEEGVGWEFEVLKKRRSQTSSQVLRHAEHLGANWGFLTTFSPLSQCFASQIVSNFSQMRKKISYII